MPNRLILFQLLIVTTVSKAQLNLSSVPCKSISMPISNGFRNGRIVGGVSATRASIPYIASLTRRGGHFCGATIINERFLLTAAHCLCTGFGELLTPHRIRAVVGLHSISEFKNKNVQTFDDNAYEIEFRNFVIHPKYTCNRPDNDIALLELNQPITFSKVVQPICISSSTGTRNKTYDNEFALISGWGNLHEEYTVDNRPDILQNANVQVWSNRECQASYNQQKKTQTIQSTQMCAGKKDGGIDACWADSGGPLVSHEDGLIGIISTGIGCGRQGLPGIYTRVSEYAQWIQHIVSKY